MSCKNHPNVDAIENCQNCKVPMCGMCANFLDIGIYCDKCESIKQNERFVEAQTQKHAKPAAPVIPLQTESEAEATQQAKKANPNTLPMVIIGVCVVIIAAMQFVAFQSRYQPIAREELIDTMGISSLQRCVLVFREIGTLLRSAQIPEESMRCDDSGTPNIIERSDGDIKVSHPHPDFYGYKDIYVSRSNTEPTLVQ